MVGEDISACPICGADIKEEMTECPKCGEKLVEEGKEEAMEELMKISAIGEERARKLYENGMEGFDDILENGVKVLVEIDGIGIDTAIEIMDETKKLQEEKEIGDKENLVETINRDLEELTNFSGEEYEELDEDNIVGDLLKEAEDSSSVNISEESMKKVNNEKEEPKEGFKNKNLEKNMPKLTVEQIGFYRDIPKAIPVITALFIPIFLLIYVGLEFVIALLAYPSVFPASSIYYLTPSPLLQPFWISSLTLSFLITIGLFLPTWKGYDFDSRSGLRLDKYMIAISAAFSAIITVSLVLHIYYSFPNPVGLLTFFLLFLSLFLLLSQLNLLWKKNTLFPNTKIRKVCPGCGESMTLITENCPRCDLEIAVPDEDIISKKAKLRELQNYDRTRKGSEQIRSKEESKDESDEKRTTEEETSEDKETTEDEDKVKQKKKSSEGEGLVKEKLNEEEEETILEDEEIL